MRIQESQLNPHPSLSLLGRGVFHSLKSVFMSISHTCDALLLTCMDFRLHPQLAEMLRRDYNISFDQFTAAGAIKNSVSPEKKEDADFVLRQIEKSIKLHQIKKIILVNHTDCGAYGGSKAFESPTIELARHKEDLNKASKIVRENFPQLEIDCFVAILKLAEEKWVIELKKV